MFVVKAKFLKSGNEKFMGRGRGFGSLEDAVQFDSMAAAEESLRYAKLNITFSQLVPSRGRRVRVNAPVDYSITMV